MTEKIMVTTDDVVKAGYCITGARRHFSALGWDKAKFRRFVREGLPVEELELVDDLPVQNSVKAAKARGNG